VARELARTLLVVDAEVPIIVREEVPEDLKRGSRGHLLKKGMRLELTLREALPLIKRGVAELDAERLLGEGEPDKVLRKVRWIESRDLSQLQALDPCFFLKVGLLLKHLEGKIDDARKVGDIKATAIDIVRLRLQKILRAVLANPEYNRDLAERLTIEERMLYATLCRTVKSWYDSMVCFLERGDIGG